MEYHHHHHRVARPWQDIAVSMSLRHLERSCARFQAELIPKLCCWRSSSIVRSQVRLGRPGGHCQSTGSRLMAARRAREWSWDGPARAMWPNRRSRLVMIRWVAGGWQVLHLTSSFVTCAVYGIRRIWRSLAVSKHALWLQEFTCHMVLHSVSCQPAEVTFPHLPQPIKAGRPTRFSYSIPRRDARLSWPGWLAYIPSCCTHPSSNRAH